MVSGYWFLGIAFFFGIWLFRVWDFYCKGLLVFKGSVVSVVFRVKCFCNVRGCAWFRIFGVLRV